MRMCLPIYLSDKLGSGEIEGKEEIYMYMCKELQQNNCFPDAQHAV